MPKILAQTKGEVLAPLTITNRIDQVLASRGFMPADRVRSLTLQNSLVDTNSLRLQLPAAIIAQLGLDLLKVSNTAGNARIFQDAKLSLHGREGTFDCVEISFGERPVIGAIPLRMLGLVPEFETKTLKILPTIDYLRI